MSKKIYLLMIILSIKSSIIKSSDKDNKKDAESNLPQAKTPSLPPTPPNSKIASPVVVAKLKKSNSDPSVSKKK